MNITRKQYTEWRKSLRKSGLWEQWLSEMARMQRTVNGVPSPIHREIDYRAKLWGEITRHARDGKVGYIVAGMDCDCCQYRYEGITDLPAGAFVYQREREHHENYLDGPESTWYVDPEGFEPQKYRSADRALEAHEDDRPSVVHTGDLETMV